VKWCAISARMSGALELVGRGKMPAEVVRAGAGARRRWVVAEVPGLAAGSMVEWSHGRGWFHLADEGGA
jgi:hypothetical protein